MIDWPTIYVLALVIYLPVVIGVFFAPSVLPVVGTTHLTSAKVVVYMRWFFETRVEKTHLSDGGYFFLSSLSLLAALAGSSLFAHHDVDFATNSFYILLLVRTIAVLYWVLLFFSYALVSGNLTVLASVALLGIDIALVGVMAWSAATVDTHRVSTATAALLVFGACFFNDFLFIFVNTLLHLSWRKRCFVDNPLDLHDAVVASGDGGVADDDESTINIAPRSTNAPIYLPTRQHQQQQQQQQSLPLQTQYYSQPIGMTQPPSYYSPNIQPHMYPYQDASYLYGSRAETPMQQTFQPPVTTEWTVGTEYKRSTSSSLVGTGS